MFHSRIRLISTIPLILLALALAPFMGGRAQALSDDALVGYWQGKYYEDPEGKESAPATVDIWKIKDEFVGSLAFAGFVFDIQKIHLNGTDLTMECPNLTRAAAKPTMFRGTVREDGKAKTAKGDMIGQADKRVATLEITWSEAPKSGLADKEIAGIYQGTGTGTEGIVIFKDGFDITVRLELEGDDVGGKVTLQGRNSDQKSARLEAKIEEIRRLQNRLYFRWRDGRGRPGKFIGTLSKDVINGTCYAPGFGGSPVRLVKGGTVPAAAPPPKAEEAKPSAPAPVKPGQDSERKPAGPAEGAPKAK